MAYRYIDQDSVKYRKDLRMHQSVYIVHTSSTNIYMHSYYATYLFYFHTVSCMDPFTCLAPDITERSNNPTITSYDVTNTSVEVWWTKPDIQECCYDVVFSYPPLMYRYQYMRDDILLSEVHVYVGECVVFL